jgi:hypothetical protein
MWRSRLLHQCTSVADKTIPRRCRTDATVRIENDRMKWKTKRLVGILLAMDLGMSALAMPVEGRIRADQRSSEHEMEYVGVVTLACRGGNPGYGDTDVHVFASPACLERTTADVLLNEVHLIEDERGHSKNWYGVSFICGLSPAMPADLMVGVFAYRSGVLTWAHVSSQILGSEGAVLKGVLFENEIGCRDDAIGGIRLRGVLGEVGAPWGFVVEKVRCEQPVEFHVYDVANGTGWWLEDATSIALLRRSGEVDLKWLSQKRVYRAGSEPMLRLAILRDARQPKKIDGMLVQPEDYDSTIKSPVQSHFRQILFAAKMSHPQVVS